MGQKRRSGFGLSERRITTQSLFAPSGRSIYNGIIPLMVGYSSSGAEQIALASHLNSYFL